MLAVDAIVWPTVTKSHKNTRMTSHLRYVSTVTTKVFIVECAVSNELSTETGIPTMTMTLILAMDLASTLTLSLMTNFGTATALTHKSLHIRVINHDDWTFNSEAAFLTL